MLNTTRPSLRMLAFRKSALTSAGVAQSAFNTWRCHANSGCFASAYAGLLSQKAFSVDRAITLMGLNNSPILGHLQSIFAPFGEWSVVRPLHRTWANFGFWFGILPPSSEPTRKAVTFHRLSQENQRLIRNLLIIGSLVRVQQAEPN